jgi:hypothetical protein
MRIGVPGDPLVLLDEHRPSSGDLGETPAHVVAGETRFQFNCPPGEVACA